MYSVGVCMRVYICICICIYSRSIIYADGETYEDEAYKSAAQVSIASPNAKQCLKIA